MLTRIGRQTITWLRRTCKFRYDLLLLPAWDSTWVIAQSAAYGTRGLDRKGDESGYPQRED